MLSYKTVVLALAYLSLSSLAAPIRREVPQGEYQPSPPWLTICPNGRFVEHSHEPILTSVRTSLNLNNPDQIQDPVFGLLGDAAAAAGQGKITNTDCLQQATADQAFTNAKAAGDVEGMVRSRTGRTSQYDPDMFRSQTNALIYRALERNTGKVGLASVACTAIKAVNPEIAALSQHQDPASSNAAATNKAITLELAKQIASVGGNAQDALKAGTFKPGNLNDNTGKGNTCDDANDPNGCIFTQNLIVDDATADEINAAVAGVSSSASAGAADNSAASSDAASSSDASATSDASDSSDASSATSCAAAVTVTVTAAAAAATNAAVAAPISAAASAVGDFGSCSVPQIEFGVGFDNRKETSFQPVDKKSFNHGSADNIDIITQFICDTLTNSCNADQTAKDTCTKAQAAADGATAKTGAQADAFNAVFGIKTNFAAVAEVDDQGRVVGAAGSAAAAAPAQASSAAAAAPVQASSAAAAPAQASAAAAAAPASAAAASSGVGNFGSCSVPQIEFGLGFDNRKETSFQPVDKKSFNHGSADNIDIITQFMCDTLTNSCNADQTAKDTCTKAKAAADTATAKTGAQADAFNAVFGIKTNFAAVAEVDDQGRVVSA
jgi:hypothetical protein